VEDIILHTWPVSKSTLKFVWLKLEGTDLNLAANKNTTFKYTKSDLWGCSKFECPANQNSGVQGPKSLNKHSRGTRKITSLLRVLASG
jgi:hypothetical protein